MIKLKVEIEVEFSDGPGEVARNVANLANLIGISGYGLGYPDMEGTINNSKGVTVGRFYTEETTG